MRLSRGYTQHKLADALGTSQSSIAAWEVGTREPDFRTIERIANFFHVPMSALLPSSDVDSDYITQVAGHLQENPKLRMLFDRSRYLSDSDLDAVLGVVAALRKERDPDA